jgi:hypothetical protein
LLLPAGSLRRWLPEILVVLWREWHPDLLEQLQLPLEMSGCRTVESGLANILGFSSPIRSSTASPGLGKPRTAPQEGTLAVAIPAGCPDWRSIASLAVAAISSEHPKPTKRH